MQNLAETWTVSLVVCYNKMTLPTHTQTNTNQVCGVMRIWKLKLTDPSQVKTV